MRKTCCQDMHGCGLIYVSAWPPPPLRDAAGCRVPLCCCCPAADAVCGHLCVALARFYRCADQDQVCLLALLPSQPAARGATAPLKRSHKARDALKLRASALDALLRGRIRVSGCWEH